MEATIPLEGQVSLEDFAALVAVSRQHCDCTDEQQCGVVVGSDDCCFSCDVRKWLNEGAELVEGL